MLIRLLYVSCRRPETTELDIRRILFAAHIYNRRQDITGVLAEFDGHFAQVLEGDRTAVMTLMATVSIDARHYNLRIVSTEEVTTRLFDQWSMGYVRRPELLAQVKELHELSPGAAELAPGLIVAIAGLQDNFIKLS